MTDQQTDEGLVERDIRIAVWNVLKERGVKDDACYPIIEGAVTDYRAALSPSPDTREPTVAISANDIYWLRGVAGEHLPAQHHKRLDEICDRLAMQAAQSKEGLE